MLFKVRYEYLSGKFWESTFPTVNLAYEFYTMVRRDMNFTVVEKPVQVVPKKFQ